MDTTLQLGESRKIGTETYRNSTFDVYLGRERCDGSYWCGLDNDRGISGNTAEQAVERFMAAASQSVVVLQ